MYLYSVCMHALMTLYYLSIYHMFCSNWPCVFYDTYIKLSITYNSRIKIYYIHVACNILPKVFSTKYYSHTSNLGCYVILIITLLDTCNLNLTEWYVVLIHFILYLFDLLYYGISSVKCHSFILSNYSLSWVIITNSIRHIYRYDSKIDRPSCWGALYVRYMYLTRNHIRSISDLLYIILFLSYSCIYSNVLLLSANPDSHVKRQLRLLLVSQIFVNLAIICAIGCDRNHGEK